VLSVNLGERLSFLKPGDPEALQALDRTAVAPCMPWKISPSLGGMTASSRVTNPGPLARDSRSWFYKFRFLGTMELRRGLSNERGHSRNVLEARCPERADIPRRADISVEKSWHAHNYDA